MTIGPRSLTRLALAARARTIDRRRARGPAVERVGDLTLVVLPGVFNPVLLRTGALLADFVADVAVLVFVGRALDTYVSRLPDSSHRVLQESVVKDVGGRVGQGRPTYKDEDGVSVLDLGCGSGVLGLSAAGWAGRVVAIDSNPLAVRCARANAVLNDREIEVRLGDGLPAGERFDLILCNPPYYRGTPRSDADRAWRSDHFADRFADGLAGSLTEHGSALVILSSDGDAGFPASWVRAGLRAEAVRVHDLGNEVVTIWRVRP